MGFNLIRARRYWYALSLLVIIPGVISLFLHGLNLGIEFTGGNVLQATLGKPASVQEVRNVLGAQGIAGLAANSQIQQSGATGFLIRMPVLSEEQGNALISSLKAKFGGITVQQDQKVGPQISGELIRNAILSILAASVLIVIWVTIRFEFMQGLAAIIALLHDTLVVTGLFSLFRIQVDSSFVAAILTIIGYSINDTIVIFDRIRENRKNITRGTELEDLVNLSLWQTVPRSINTVLTVIFVLTALLLVGGTTIKTMVLALLIGVISGGYSSIFNASPLWVDFKLWDKRRRVRRAQEAA
ncbi:MAG: protein translocase subunit SecF [Peptococcaceae bacterium]|jgi:preprotein translocase subunit SecF|nr:protein translocase subunit SecF [Peptococcaceae bacterium]